MSFHSLRTLRISAIALLSVGMVALIGAARFSTPDTLSAHAFNRAALSDRISIRAEGQGRPLISFANGRDLITGFSARDELRRMIETDQADPLSLASDDFDGDGVPDLVCGYEAGSGGVIAIHRGNVDSIYPNSPEARRRRMQGDSTDSPFLSPARLFSTPEPASLIATGDFDADGHRDVITASRGTSRLYLFSGNGRGEIGAARSIELPGRLTSMIVGEINRRDGLEDIVVALSTGEGANVLVFEGPEGAFDAAPEEITISAPASSLALGLFDDDYLMDLAAGAGRELVIAHGRDRKLSLDEKARSAVLEPEISRQTLPFEISLMIAGDFAGDDDLEIAIISEEGELYLSSRSKSSDKEWGIEETATGRWPGASGMIKLRASSPKDALMVIDGGERQMHVIGSEFSHGKRLAGRRLVTLDVEGKPRAALQMRLNSDALGDLVMLRSGTSRASVMLSQPGATFTVTNTNGFGAGSLFEAILDANETPGADTIAFNIPGAGPFTITQSLELPMITDPVVLDGTTQPGYSGTPVIEVTGALETGFSFTASNNTVRGLAVNRFTYALRLFNSGNIVEANFMGANLAGTATINASIVGVFGMNNIIGGTVAAARNLLGGVECSSNGSNNTIIGNFINTNLTGTGTLGFGRSVRIQNTLSNTVGGTMPGARNIISGGLNDGGINIEGDNSAGNLVQGNYIGTDVSGSVVLGNAPFGVNVGGFDNTVGGTTAAARNIISGNSGNGIHIRGGMGVHGILVQGNYIGTDVSGSTSLANGQNGVFITNASSTILINDNTIGGATDAARNIISGNFLSGVLLEGSGVTQNRVQGNYIGTDATGGMALANGLNGITTSEAPANLIGGPDPGAGNVISANGRHGISIGINTSGGSTGITVQNNFIGTAADGVSCLGNARDGIFVNLNSVGHSIIGNTIACNSRNGVFVPNFADADPGIRINIQSTIHSNSVLGIDLGEAGVTANDPADPDIGANTLQNFPVISSVTFSAGTLHIVGNLNSTPNTDFFVQFFSSSECTGSNPGQDQQMLTGLPIVFHTDAAGNAAIDLTLMVTPIGGWVNALATSSDGNTSEFSPCTEINASCSYSIEPTSQNFGSGGGAGSVSVTAGSGCNWTAVSSDSFITITSGIDGTGNGMVEYSVAANTGSARMGTMTIAGQTFTLNQDGAPCTYSINPLSAMFGAAGGSDTVTVTAPSGCDWTAVSNDSFIMITSGSMGTGNGSVNYSVSANTGPSRSGTMTIAGQTFTVNQTSGCEFTLERASQSFAATAGAGTINVTAAQGCDWTAVSNASWITITSGSNGSGDGVVSYSVEANPDPTIRSSTITVAGHSFRVFQGILFNDVPEGHLFFTEIGKLSARGVTLGCGGGNYCPDQAVTRDQMAAFIIRALGIFNPPPPAMQRFLDVPPSNPFYAFIEEMAVRQITLGCGGGNYCPSQPVLREQMAAFIIRGIGEFNPPQPAQQRFLDVPPSNPFYAFIEEMAVRQITLGCGGGNYCPSESVTRAQMAAFLVRAFNL